MTKQQTPVTLQAACLAATLVTAFSAAPAQASSTIGPDFTTTGTGTRVYDAMYADSSGSVVQTTPYRSGFYPPAFAIPDGAGIVVFVQNTDAATYLTESFSTAFSGVDEAQVLGYLQAHSFGSTPTSAQSSNYTSFINDIYTQDPLDASLPATAILFSNGQSAGTAPASTFNNHPSGTFALFGVAPEPAPEPGAVAGLALGILGLAGLGLRARRRS